DMLRIHTKALTRSSMRTGATPLPPSLAFRLRRRHARGRSAVAPVGRGDCGELRRGGWCGRLLGGLERRFHAALADGLPLPAGDLRLACPPDATERGGDERC